MPNTNSGSLTRKSLTGAAWTTVGYGLIQILRLLSSLILTRLLAPECFGINAIIGVIMIGLNMFSDVGLGPNIIQNPRSRDVGFLNSAWSLQIVRGIGLWLVCTALAYPFAGFYKEPQLVYLLPVAGLTCIVDGLLSTNVVTNSRDLNVTRLTLLEVASQICVVCFMVIAARIHPSVWVLVFGGLFGAVVKTVSSHLFLPGVRNRFAWDTETANELIRFGRWIFFSTVLTFANNSMGSLIMGKLVSMSDVGLFSIAATLAKTVENVFGQIAQKILFPLYNKIKDLPHDQLVARVRRIRVAVNAFFLPILWVLSIWGGEVIELLFDDRYHGAGWILRIFAVGLIPSVVSGIGPFYLALGNSKLLFFMSCVRFVSYVGSMIVGWWMCESKGVIVGMACYTIIVYVAEATIQRSYKIWLPAIDIVGLASSFLVIGCASYLR